MAEITAAAVMKLRERTDLPMMRCKKALMEADGDEEKAIAILQEQVKGLIAKRADNTTAEGRVFVAIADDNSKGAIVDFQCETAPVAGSPAFIELGEALVNQLLNGPGAATAEELLAQNAPGKDVTMQSMLEELINKIGEKFVVAHIAVLEGPLGTYTHHDFKTAVIFQAEGEKMEDPILRDVAMHIAALKPKVTKPEDLDAADIAAERERLTEEAKASGKPENIIDKIVDGRMNVFYQNSGVLVAQPFAKDDSKSVEKVLSENGYTAKSFVCRSIGGSE